MADYTQVPTAVVFSDSAVYVDGIAGEAINTGQPVYLDTSTDPDKYKLADANASAATAAAVGVAATTAVAAGQPIRVCWKDPDYTPGFTLSAGQVVIVSANAGGIAPVADLTTGWRGCALGMGKASNKMNLSLVSVSDAR